MKSTTLRRSNISRERIKSIEALSKYRRRNYGSSQSNIQPIKDKELDILWQNLKQQNSKYEKSPIVYIITGFILGAVSMLILTTIVNLSMNAVKQDSFDTPAPVEASAESSKLTFIPADTSDVKTSTTTSESYTVQSGDTLESIVIRFYGSYSDANAKKVEKANGISNPNQLQLGQKLTIPLN